MRIELNVWSRIVFSLVLGVTLMVNLALAMDKYSTGTRSNDFLKPSVAGETVVNKCGR